MRVLSGLEPQGVLRFFEEIAAIPHGSHNTRAISDYLADFARARGLRFRQDAADNVIIWKDASPGYEAAPAVMLQGHMDMVCEKATGCEKDMAREGLELFVEGDEIGARGTTLGADDGIAVAMALAVLDDDAIAHGPLECLFTADEEVGMLGAQALDCGDLKARYLLNIDSAEEGVLTVSCAGSVCGHDPAPGRARPLRRPLRGGDPPGPRQRQPPAGAGAAGRGRQDGAAAHPGGGRQQG